jgi:hypothetical protein
LRNVSAARLGQFRRFRQAEVENLQHTLGRNFEIRRFQIAVNDSPFVGRFEPRGDLARVVDDGFDRQRADRARALD